MVERSIVWVRHRATGAYYSVNHVELKDNHKTNLDDVRKSLRYTNNYTFLYENLYL